MPKDEFPYPLSLFDDPFAFTRWVEETREEGKEPSAVMVAAARAHIDEHGAQVALKISRLVDDCQARLEEFIC